MPRPPAEPACSARDGRRHAACRLLPPVAPLVAASGAPPVRSSRECALRVNRLTVGRTWQRRLFAPSALSTFGTRRDTASLVLAAKRQQKHLRSADTSALAARSSLSFARHSPNARASPSVRVPDKTPCEAASARGLRRSRV